MNLFKNAALYTAELPSIELMAQHLAERPFLPIGENFLSSSGFVQNVLTGELVTPIAGGYSFTVRYDEKILPQSSVTQAALDAFELLKQEHGGEVMDEKYSDIKEAVFADMVKRAIPKSPVYVNCFYHEESQNLIIPTTSKVLAQTVMRLLIQAVGSVKTATIWVDNVKGGLTTRLKALLGAHQMPAEANAFGNCEAGDTVVLRHKKAKVVVDVDSLERAKRGLLEALEGEMIVESMALTYNGVSFKLAHDFRLKSIQFIESLSDEEREERYGEEADGAHIWRVEAGVQLLLMVEVVRELCEMFSYKPSIITEPEPVDIKLLDSVAEIDDELYQEAVDHVRETQRASVSSIQRELKIGYNRAYRLVDRMEQDGIVTPMNSHGMREVVAKPRQTDLEDFTGKPNAE